MCISRRIIRNEWGVIGFGSRDDTRNENIKAIQLEGLNNTKRI